MTQIDFYILTDQASSDRYALACRIADKAWQQGHRVYVHTNSQEESRHMDRQLWVFRENSFIPHGIAGQSDPALNPILIGNDDNAVQEHDVLINLAAEVPAFFSRFERVAELIDKDPEIKSAGRNRFRFYRDRGYALSSHQIEQ